MKPKAEISQKKGIVSSKVVVALPQEGNMLLPFKYRTTVSLRGKASSFVLEHEL